MILASKAVVVGPQRRRFDEILTDDALRFVTRLDNEFAQRRVELLARRADSRKKIAAGGRLDFLDSTRAVRHDLTWRAASPPPDLLDRRVEITGPPERKMTINALNSGAQVWMADFEDATSPTWENIIGGQLNLVDAFERRLDFTSEEGKDYQLGETWPAVMVRPRGWHLPEKHLCVDGRPMAGSIVDFGLYFFHCAQRRIAAGSGPYFYLPKLENHHEARLWNDVFTFAQELLGVPHGTIRATVLVETITAAFEMDEILFELREHSAGLNAGRWDYTFSIIKNFRDQGVDYLLPDRAEITMTVPFMRAYTELLVSTCHRRGAHAIGGMAAFVPNRRDAHATAQALEKVRGDKEREAADGFDGSWVAHPDLVRPCREVFDAALQQRPHQISRTRDDVRVTAAQLLAIATTPGRCTEDGLRNNINVSLRYLDSWLAGNGAVAINNLMEDAATAEISRSQIWQWLRNRIEFADGSMVDNPTVRRMIDEELAGIRAKLGEVAYERSRFPDARALLEEVALSTEYVDFLTLPGYQRLVSG